MGFLGPDMRMNISHRLSPTEVIERLQAQLSAKMQTAFPQAQIKDLRQQWKGSTGTFSCTADGRDIKGTMSVNATTLAVEVDLPFGASMVIDVDTAKRNVESELSTLLA